MEDMPLIPLTEWELFKHERSNDIVGRLRDLLKSDHERGCEGRTYSCACGYDNRMERALNEAADEIERLRAELFKHERYQSEDHSGA